MFTCTPPAKSSPLYIKDPAFAHINVFICCVLLYKKSFLPIIFWNYIDYSASRTLQPLKRVFFFSFLSLPFPTETLVFCVIEWAITVITFPCIHPCQFVFCLKKRYDFYAFLFSSLLFWFSWRSNLVFCCILSMICTQKASDSHTKVILNQKHAAKKLFNASSWIPPFQLHR